MIPHIWIPYVAILIHILGDFFGQSDWMAMNKNKNNTAAAVHVLIYTSCFLLLTFSWKALLLIGLSHYIIDRHGHYYLKRLIWLKQHFPLGKYPPFRLCDTTGYYDDSPYNSYPSNKHTLQRYGQPRHREITWWLYIIQDNALHLFFNFIALAFLT